MEQTANTPAFVKCLDVKWWRHCLCQVQNISCMYLALPPVPIPRAPPLPGAARAGAAHIAACIEIRFARAISRLSLATKRQRVRLRINWFILGLQQNRKKKKKKKKPLNIPIKNRSWPLCTAFSQAMAQSFWGHDRMESIDTLQNPTQICTDYLHEAEFAQRNTLLFDWLILFGQGWGKAFRHRITSSWPNTEQIYPVPHWTLPGKRQHLWMHLGRLVISTRRRSATGVVWARSALLVSMWELGVCPGPPDVWQPGWNQCTCQRAGQNF